MTHMRDIDCIAERALILYGSAAVRRILVPHERFAALAHEAAGTMRWSPRAELDATGRLVVVPMPTVEEVAAGIVAGGWLDVATTAGVVRVTPHDGDDVLVCVPERLMDRRPLGLVPSD